MALKTWKAQIGNREFQFKMKKDDAGRVAREIKNVVNLHQFTRKISNSYLEDGKEYVSTTMALFGPGQAPILDQAGYQAELAAALDKWAPILICELNRAPILADFKAIYDKHIPVLDKRTTPEQRAQENKECAEREATRAAQEKSERSAHLTQFSNGPDTEMIQIQQGSMAIYLETIYDASEAMTDYYHPHQQVGPDLLLAIVPKQAKTQALARLAVSRYPELAAIDFTWHTENYSMGKGNYLESGYEVDYTDGAEARRLQYVVKFDEYSKAKYPYKAYPGIPGVDAAYSHIAPAATTGAATIKQNLEKSGIEIRFADRPDEAVLARLKSHGWRWSRFSKCWYAKQSDAAESFANELVGALAPEADEPAEEESVTADDMQAITGQEWDEEAMENFRAVC
jgi:hypothetical protein